MEQSKKVQKEKVRKLINEKHGDRRPAAVRDNALRIEDMVGLGSVKETYEMISKRIVVERELAKRGSGLELGAMNFVFEGNPGTAKTTVAKMLGKEFKEKGILSSGHTVCAGRKDIIAKYAGHTTRNMKEAFRKSLGGVLFLDEVYSLVEKWGDRKYSGFGQEAIDTLVEELGEPCSDRVVIVAGYIKEVEEFIQTNPGLTSRFNYRFTFDDYSPEELLEILQIHAAAKGLKLEAGTEKELIKKIKPATGIKDFGNGRFAINILNRAVDRQRVRLYDIGVNKCSDEDVKTIKLCDFNDLDRIIKDITPKGTSDRKVIGF